MVLERATGGDRVKELKEKRRRQRRIRFFIGLISVIVIVGSVIFISRTRQMQIQSVIVRGNYIVQSDDVKAAVNAILQQKYAWIIPKSNVLIYPSRELHDAVSSQFQRFNSVEFHLENWSTLVIDVTERKNVYLWCDMLPAAAVGKTQTCYYVDDHGYIFSRSPSFTGNVYFVFYGNYTWEDNESPVGKKLFEDTYFRDVIRFKEGIATAGLTTYGFIRYSTGVSSFLLSPSFNDTKQKIVLTTTQDLPTLFSNLSLALTSEDLKKELAEKFSTLQYFDLRYDKKVYYKFGSSPDITDQETVPLEPVQ